MSSEGGRRKGDDSESIFARYILVRFSRHSLSVFTHYTFLPQLQIQRTL
jgi:hypothetical protein